MKPKLFRISLVAAALTMTLSQAALPQVAAAATPQRVSIAAGTEVTVTVDSLNVRSSPSLQGDVIGRLTGGTKVAPTGKTTDDAWWQISYSGQTGYIYAQYATVGGTYGGTTAAAASTGSGTVTVTSDYLNVRSGPGTGYDKLGQLNNGQTVQTTGKSSDGAWWQFSYNGQTAYIYAAYTSGGGAAAATTTTASTGTAASGGFELGAHIKSFDYLSQMKDIGMTWVKYQAVLPGDMGGAQNVINTAHANGMKALIGAKGDINRAGDVNYHSEFAGYLATLASSGADAIEVWNEPNLDREYGGGGTGQVNPENYVDMLQKAYGAIKAANGGTMVVGGATAPTGYYGGGCSAAGCDDAPFVARIAAAGAASYMDCMGAHHNGTMVGPDQTSGAPVGSADHHQWYFWGTLDTVYNAFGGKVPVCWTELGYVTGEGIGALPSGFSWGSSITLDNQAQWLARAAQLSRDSGKVRLMIIWNADFRQWDSDPQAGFSIFRPNGECRACSTIKAAMGS